MYGAVLSFLWFFKHLQAKGTGAKIWREERTSGPGRAAIVERVIQDKAGRQGVDKPGMALWTKGRSLYFISTTRKSLEWTSLWDISGDREGVGSCPCGSTAGTDSFRGPKLAQTSTFSALGN